MEIKDRMEQHRLALGMTVQAFEKKCGFSNGSWTKTNEITEKFLIKFLNAFPGIDPAWLLRGDGTKDLEAYQSEARQVRELLDVCKKLLKNHRQHNDLVSRLASMVEQMD